MYIYIHIRTRTSSDIQESFLIKNSTSFGHVRSDRCSTRRGTDHDLEKLIPIVAAERRNGTRVYAINDETGDNKSKGISDGLTITRLPSGQTLDDQEFMSLAGAGRVAEFRIRLYDTAEMGTIAGRIVGVETPSSRAIKDLARSFFFFFFFLFLQCFLDRFITPCQFMATLRGEIYRQGLFDEGRLCSRTERIMKLN